MKARRSNLGMHTKGGFGFIALLIVVAIIAFLAIGGFFTRSLKQKQSTIETGLEAEKRAQELKDLIENRSRAE